MCLHGNPFKIEVLGGFKCRNSCSDVPKTKSSDKLNDTIKSTESITAEECDIEMGEEYWKDIWKKVHIYKDNEAKSDVKGTAYLIESNHHVLPNELIWTIHDRELKTDEIVTFSKTNHSQTPLLVKLLVSVWIDSETSTDHTACLLPDKSPPFQPQ